MNITIRIGLYQLLKGEIIPSTVISSVHWPAQMSLTEHLICKSLHQAFKNYDSENNKFLCYDSFDRFDAMIFVSH